MTDKLRKYVLPNIPYVFIGWVFLKLGTAYRLAAGVGFGEKLLGLGQTIGAAFASFTPGLAPLDWLVGIVGAVGFRLLIYCKAKKVKKFRRDAEYGTARWGNEKDIKPFVDPKFENNMLLTATERLTMNTRPKNPANARNLNFCGIGSSGSGKTRFWLTPQLLQAHSSYVVVDPKGGVLGQVGAFLQKRGYKIKVFNSIDFSKSMHPDGICQIPGGLYTKTLEYEDINYAVASTEDQTAIISGWSACLNYFDSSLPFQLSFVNRRSRNANRYKVNIPAQEDDFNSIRGEYVEMLKGQIAKSNNGIERYKYITFGLPAEGVAEARPRLGRVEADVMGNLKRLGVQSRPLDGRDRLAVLHGQMHPGGREPFRFAWKDIPKTGMGTKDYIAPDSFDFRQSRTFRVGQMWGAASYLQIMASELSDKLLAEILELDAELTVTMHIQTVDQLKAIKTMDSYKETLESIKKGVLYSKDDGDGDTYSMIPPTEDVVSSYSVDVTKDNGKTVHIGDYSTVEELDKAISDAVKNGQLTQEEADSVQK